MSVYEKGWSSISGISMTSSAARAVGTAREGTAPSTSQVIFDEELAAQAPQKYQVAGQAKKEDDRWRTITKRFTVTEPELLFTADYIVENERKGCLLVWRWFQGGTHYEIYKRNLFRVEESTFLKIFAAGRDTLESYRDKYWDYIVSTLGIDFLEKKDTLVFYDNMVKEDRIYDYSVQAIYVPETASRIFYDITLFSKNRLGELKILETDNSTLSEAAQTSLGSPDFAWLLGAVNKNITFFGRTFYSEPLTTAPESTEDFFSEEEEVVQFPPATSSGTMSGFSGGTTSGFSGGVTTFGSNSGGAKR